MKRLVIAFLLLFLAPLHATADYLAVLAAGQSNTAGAFGPSPSAGIYSPTFKAWNVTTNDFETAQLGSTPFLPSSGGVVPNNFVFVFAKELSRYCEKEVRLVLIASGGKKIEYFLPDTVLTANSWTNTQTSPLYGDSASQELFGYSYPHGDAIPALDSIGKDEFDVVVMHQGEQNAIAGDSAATYEAKLDAFYGEGDARGMWTLGATPVLLGHINSAYSGSSNHATAVTDFAASHDMVGVVTWAGIDTMQSVEPSNYHASGTGLEQLGVRYFRKLLEIDPDPCN